MRLFLALIRMIVRAFAVLGLVAFVLAALLVDFLHRTDVDHGDQDLPSIAIVFTGQFDRIHLGLDLLSSGRVDQLFITGVNGGAGLNTERFVTQFELSAEQAGWLETGRIVLATDADNTFENAWETGCWLDQQPADPRAVTLITSRIHMARASVALQHEIWPLDVVRVYSDPLEPYDDSLLNVREFGAFVVTWAITLLPHALWPADMPALCLAQTPENA